MIKFDSVEYQYPNGGFSTKPLDFEISYGECIALTGENGCGKTTVGKLAVGILRPSRGRVFIKGTDIAALTLGQIGTMVGYLFQDPSRQLFAPTVLEDLTFPNLIAGTDKSAAESSARSALSKMGILHLENRSVYRLSGGEKQRLAIAGMIMKQNLVSLILDEPTTGLDPKNREILGDIITVLADEGVSILLITHDMEFAENYCRRKIIMNKGAIIL